MAIPYQISCKNHSSITRLIFLLKCPVSCSTAFAAELTLWGPGTVCYAGCRGVLHKYFKPQRASLSTADNSASNDDGFILRCTREQTDTAAHSLPLGAAAVLHHRNMSAMISQSPGP